MFGENVNYINLNENESSDINKIKIKLFILKINYI